MRFNSVYSKFWQPHFQISNLLRLPPTGIIIQVVVHELEVVHLLVVVHVQHIT